MNLFLRNKRFVPEAKSIVVANEAEFKELLIDEMIYVVYNRSIPVQLHRSKINSIEYNVDRIFIQCSNPVMMYLVSGQIDRSRNEDITTFNDACQLESDSFILTIQCISELSLLSEYCEDQI